MQDEVTKHTKKIYEAAKSPRMNFGEKLKEIIIEIFIIVFAVTLSIWLHTWSEHRQQQKEVKEFLSDLKEDLNNDIVSMQAAKESLSKSADNYLFAAQLTKEKLDSVIKKTGTIALSSNIGTTKISNGNYEGFKSSGRIGFIENKELKKHILKYYQETTPDIVEAENINTSQVLKLTSFWTENADQNFKKIFLNPKFKALLQSVTMTEKGSFNLYVDAILLAKEIIAEIDSEKK